MRTWKVDYDNRLRSTLDSSATSVPSSSSSSTTPSNVAIEQSKILQELELGKKKEQEKGGIL